MRKRLNPSPPAFNSPAKCSNSAWYSWSSLTIWRQTQRFLCCVVASVIFLWSQQISNLQPWMIDRKWSQLSFAAKSSLLSDWILQLCICELSRNCATTQFCTRVILSEHTHRFGLGTWRDLTVEASPIWWLHCFRLKDYGSKAQG